jgi:alanyl-tRNA synthetase
VYHYLPEALVEGAPVEGKIDFPRRFDFMQQHTGQHIISACLIKTSGYRTISAYLGDSYTAVEIDTDTIQEQQIEAAERMANQTVTSNLPVRIQWVSPEEAETLQLRKPPPAVERLRIVQIEGVDAAACAGIHVGTTGEVGLIKFEDLEKIRGRLRLHWLIGERAYRDIRDKDSLVRALNRELTCGTPEILASVRELKNKLRSREQRIAQLERNQAAQTTRDLLAASEIKDGIRVITKTFDQEHPSFVQTVFQALLGERKTAACLINKRAENMQWLIGCSGELALPWKKILPPLLPLIEGKGGGRGSSWQGVGRNLKNTETFLQQVQAEIRHQLSDND